MKLPSSFILVIHSILLFLLSILTCSCEKDKTEGPMRSYLEIRDKVRQASRDNLTIDALEYGEKVCVVSFSDDDVLVIPIDSITVFSIDLTGYWRINQNSGNLIPKIEDETMDFTNDTRISFVEGYTDWTFYFSDDLPIVLTKSLYSYDADAIVKGVNHRGYNKTAPENTLPAFRLSKLQGFNYVETDIRFTSDGVPVLLHDESIDRTSNGQGKIQNMSFTEVRSFDFGNWKDSSFRGTKIPTLVEFLSLCAEIGLSPHLELKAGTKNQVFKIIDLVEHFGLSNDVTYISFDQNLLRYVLEKTPDACVGVLTKTVDESVITKAASINTNLNKVYIGASDYSETAISLCRQSGFPLSIWVVDSKEKILKLPRYVSGVSSNYLHAGRVLYEAGQIR